jgi:hypothetical protein
MVVTVVTVVVTYKLQFIHVRTKKIDSLRNYPQFPGNVEVEGRPYRVLRTIADGCSVDQGILFFFLYSTVIRLDGYV